MHANRTYASICLLLTQNQLRIHICLCIWTHLDGCVQHHANNPYQWFNSAMFKLFVFSIDSNFSEAFNIENISQIDFAFRMTTEAGAKRRIDGITRAESSNVMKWVKIIVCLTTLYRKHFFESKKKNEIHKRICHLELF